MFEILSIICVLITFTHYVEYTGCKLKKQTGIFFIHKGKEMIGHGRVQNIVLVATVPYSVMRETCKPVI